MPLTGRCISRLLPAELARHWRASKAGDDPSGTAVIHSDAVNLLAWEKGTPYALGDGDYAIATVNGHYLTATGGGGKITDAIHSDATRIGVWEKFRFVCWEG